MHNEIKKLADYLDQIQLSHSNEDPQSPLEVLYLYDAQFRRLDSLIRSLSPEEQCAVLDTLCAICTAQEMAAFIRGVRTGTRLAAELFPE